MLGLFGTLNLGARSLSTQQAGTEIAGHNLANVNNPAYARQRLTIQTSQAIPGSLGLQGSGAEGVNIVQIRNVLIDHQIQTETSVRGSLDARQGALQNVQANLGQQIDRQGNASGTDAVGGQHGLAEYISGFFSAFQSLSTNPTSLAERQVTLSQAQNLTSDFNQVSTRLAAVNATLNQSVGDDVGKVNASLDLIAKLNQEIINAEVGGQGVANDLRDSRQQEIESLAQLTSLTATPQSNGGIDIAIGGVTVISGPQVLDRIETYDPGSGQLLVRAQTAGTPLTLTGGSIQGAIDARDGTLATLRGQIDNLAAQFITEVNTIHSGGFDLNGNTGQPFFTGTDAATIAVNGVLTADPSRLQAAGVAGAPGDNQVALALAQLADKKIPALSNQTFNQSYGQSVTQLGQDLASVNAQIETEGVVQNMLSTQRESISGVSLDEEMTDLIRFQKAFQASARLITKIDEMLDTVVNMLH